MKIQEKAPLVSVVMPAYNTEKYVGEAVQSILARNRGCRQAKGMFTAAYSHAAVSYMYQGGLYNCRLGIFSPKKIYLLLLMFVLFACKENKLGQIDKTVIPVADAIGTGEILNLSDYAKSVKYIPLETNDSVLIGKLSQVIALDDKYLISDSPLGQASRCYLFDGTGHYTTQIGSIGHGPGQYTSTRSIDINDRNKRILLETIPKCFEYDWNGVLMDEKVKEDSAGYHPFQTMYIDENIYLSTISTPNVREYKAFLYEKSDTGLKIVRTYPNHFQREKTGVMKGGWGTTDGKIFRGKNQIRYWRDWDDTISTFNSKQDLETAFIFDYGKYKAPLEWMFSYREDYATVNYIYAEGIKESKNYLFIQFSLGSNAPEKYEYEQTALAQRNWQIRKRMNVSVYSVFDKNTGRLRLLNQPVKHKYLGFRNDLDGGPCFWPKYISSKDEMVTWFTADQLLDIYEQLPNPSNELKAVVKKLNPDDNPVLMVVQLK